MKFRSIILSSVLAVLCMATMSCDREVIPSKGAEDFPVHSITVSATAPYEEVSIVTKASDVAETRLESLDLILIPKTSGGKAVVLPGGSLTLDSQPSSTHYHYTATFEIPESAGLRYGEYYMYAVGNSSKNYVHANISGLNGLTKDEIDSYLASKANSEIDFSESALLMTGKYGSDGSVYLGNETNNLDGTIHLFRLVSKHKITIVGGEGVTFEPTSYSIYNYPLSCTLFERDAWNGDAPKSGFDYVGNTSASSFTELVNGELEDGSCTFYMPENMQTSYPSEPASWSYLMREVRQDYTAGTYSADAHSKFAYAPSRATYVVIKGNYRDADYRGTVAYTIHLGGFGSNVDNFSVRRNYKYDYRITVNGVNKIIAEAKSSSFDQPYQPGAEGDIIGSGSNTIINVDSHYEQVMISYNVMDGTNNYVITVNTPFTAGTVVDDGSNSLADNDVKWIKFGKPTGDGKFAAYDPDNVGTVYDLIDDLKTNGGNTYTREIEGRIYICAYVDEYFYADKAIADFVNGDNRFLQLSMSNVSVSPDKNSTFTDGVLFRITQRPIKCDEALTIAVPFGYEAIEETIPYCGDDHPDTKENVNIPNSLQVSNNGTEKVNGWANFSQWVIGKNWNAVVNVAENGHFSEDDNGAAMQSAYNYGWYQCLSRNRDENGNGVVDQDEVKWYLPAVNQYLTLMVGRERYFNEFVSGVDNPLYLTSTTYGENSGKFRTWFAAEGLAYGAWGAGWWKNWNLHVRCARTLNASSNAAPSDVYTYTSETRTIAVNGLLDEVVRSSTMTGGYEPHNLANSTLTRLPKAFAVASEDLNVSGKTKFSVAEISDEVDLCAANYSEGEYGVGTWRIPNAKEFYLMVKEKLVNNSTSSRTMSAYYNTDGTYSTNGTALIYYLSNVISTDVNSSPWTQSGGAAIRCVRDVPEDGGDLEEGGDI